MDVVDSREIAQRCNSALDIVAIAARQIRRTLGSNVSVEELESCGREGLFDAARRYDASRRVSFRTYAWIRVRGAIIDGVRQIMPVPRRVWYKLRALDALALVSGSFAEGTERTAEEATSPRNADALLVEHLAAMATAIAVGLIPQTVIDEGDVALREDETPEEALLRLELRSEFERLLGELPRQ